MAIKSYKKGSTTKLSTNFNSTEFDCHGSGCCSATLVDEKLVEYLQKIRTHFNQPVTISSGYRCSVHNQNVGGVTGSRHSKGQAADIYIKGVTPAEIAKYAESIGILGIGLYETDDDGHFVHIDTREYKSFWYGQKQTKRTTFGGAIVKEEEQNTTSLYSNSPLVTYTNITKNKTSPRNHAIDTITIHCIVGQWTAKQGCDYFATTNNQCSANYIVGKDGSIGLSVDEKDRSWCSSSSSNDNRAITIEVASDTTHPYAVTDAAYKALIELVADICKRNNIKELKWKGDKSLIGQVDQQNMTVHRWFANKACPGEYLYEKHDDIVNKVNEKLGVVKKDETPAAPVILYRVRKTWEDAKSQIGAYKSLSNAKAACDKAGLKYFVFDEDGVIVYPEANTAILDTSHIDTKAADPEKIWNFFKDKGLNNCGVAGLMGNLYAESGLRPTNLQDSYEKKLDLTDAEYTVAVDGNIYTNFIHDGAGYGLAQWTYWSLKEDMLEYFQERSKSIGDLDTQLEFLAYQLSTSYKAVWSILKTAETVREASDAVLLKFERPADQSVAVQEKRAAYGQKYFDAYATEEKISIQIPKEGENGQMKYSDKNKPLVCMQTNSTCYKGTSKMQVKGVLWHSTGANNPWLKRYVQPSDNASDREAWLELLGKNQYNNDWNHITRQAGLNCWIGKLADGTVTTVQTMPWDYKPWGCGSGSKGSCNNGWIQFEICEDGLTDKDYFEKVYNEACEITAYLCDLYNIDPNGTVDMNGIKVPTILCHADSNKLGFGSNHGDVNHWFPKHGKSMATARKDVADLLNTNATPSQPSIIVPDDNEVEVIEIYRVRKTWEDSKSQIGAYKLLKNAIAACDKAGTDYEVYDSNGIAVYPEKEEASVETPATNNFKVGDVVKLISGATYTSGTAIPAWLFKYKLYVRDIRKSGAIVISTQKSGAVTGVVNPKFLVPYGTATSVVAEPTFTPYLVKIDTSVLNVRAGAGTTYKITTQVKKNQIYTIVAEKDGWGKLKSGAGWIHLNYTTKV